MSALNDLFLDLYLLLTCTKDTVVTVLVIEFYYSCRVNSCHGYRESSLQKTLQQEW